MLAARSGRLAALLAALALVACRAEAPVVPTPVEPPTPAPSPTQQVEALEPAGDALRGKVVLWMDWPPAETSWLAGLLAQFRERHPGVELSLRYVPTDSYHDVVRSQALEPEGPTILFAPSSWATELYDAGLTQEVTERVSPELRGSLLPITWSQVEDGERVLGLPIEMQGMLLYRNPALLPEGAPSVEEMRVLAEELPRGTGLVLDLGMQTSMPFMSACGGTLMLVDSKLQVDEAVGVCWLRLLQRMAGIGRISSDPQADLEAFEAGDAGWVVESTEHLPRIEKALGHPAALDDWPLYGETGKPLSGYTWTLNAYLRSGLSVEDAEASWAFLQLMLSPQAQLDRSRLAGVIHLPVLAEAEGLSGTASRARALLAANTPLPLARGLAEFVEPLERAARLVAPQSGVPLTAWRRAMETLRVQPSPSAP
jgi:ABC-type glycerol-3-phosphate transport system substrate-binding protein